MFAMWNDKGGTRPIRPMYSKQMPSKSEYMARVENIDLDIVIVLLGLPNSSVLYYS